MTSAFGWMRKSTCLSLTSLLLGLLLMPGCVQPAARKTSTLVPHPEAFIRGTPEDASIQKPVATRDRSIQSMFTSWFSGKPNRSASPGLDRGAEASQDIVKVDVITDPAVAAAQRERQRKLAARPNRPIVAQDWRSVHLDPSAAPLSLPSSRISDARDGAPRPLPDNHAAAPAATQSPSRVSKPTQTRPLMNVAFHQEEQPNSELSTPVDEEPSTVEEPVVPRRRRSQSALSRQGPTPELNEFPATPGPVRIPLAGDEPEAKIEVTMKNGRVSLVARDAPVQSVLNLLAQQQGLNLITADDVEANVSVTLTEVQFEDALSAIVAIAGCTWTQQRGIVLVSKMGSGPRGAPEVQGKVIQVFNLNFVSAVDLERTIKGFLSPMGQIFISQTSPTDKRRTQELVVVEDIPASVSRIEQYIAQVDQPPRQVMIEVHVLQVDLIDNTTHGVNWQYITKVAGSDVALSTVGFANPAASPASFFSLQGDHLDLVVQALKTTTTAKTLANPKIVVANGQEARIQIGSKLGYFVTTTTQTSTLQNVNFLNTGVVLRVTPQISNDNRVLMVVRPEVSTGSISAAGLPQTNTTEAETTLMMEDGGGMLIGGLIKETDTDVQNKVPILGDMWLVGRFFQNRTFARERNEVVIALIPRIAPYPPDYHAYEQTKVQQTNVPLFQNGLQQASRPFDPALPDAINNPRRLLPNRLPSLLDHPSQTNPKPLNYYFPTDCEAAFPPGNLNRPATLVNPPVNYAAPLQPIPEAPLNGYDDRMTLPPAMPAEQIPPSPTPTLLKPLATPPPPAPQVPILPAPSATSPSPSAIQPARAAAPTATPAAQKTSTPSRVSSVQRGPSAPPPSRPLPRSVATARAS